MATTYCPHCRSLVATRTVVEPAPPSAGGEQPALRIHHCARCHAFIRSEAVPKGPAKQPA